MFSLYEPMYLNKYPFPRIVVCLGMFIWKKNIVLLSPSINIAFATYKRYHATSS